MKENVSDFLVRRLSEWGVKRIFGFPGDSINGMMGALNRAPKKIDFIQVRHEEMAAFMACARAKFTGEVGICLATSGPGVIHLLDGLYDAKLDHQPVVAIVGQQKRAALGAIISRKSTLFRCSRTLRMNTSIWFRHQSRCGIWLIAPCASPRLNATCAAYRPQRHPGDGYGKTAA
jgi:hypothetical protein